MIVFGIGTLFLFYRYEHIYVVKHEMYIFNMYFDGFKNLSACSMFNVLG